MTTYAVGREKIREYAHAVGETDPRYLDPEKARGAGYPSASCASTVISRLPFSAPEIGQPSAAP